MRSIFLFLLNLCFVFSVLFIWVMLLYQFFLTLRVSLETEMPQGGAGAGEEGD